MEQATLVVHRGATRMTREALPTIEPPESTATWKPIKHADVVDCLYEELGRREIGITHEEYAVQRKGNYLFGVMTLNYLKTDEFAAALAFRHSNDMQEGDFCISPRKGIFQRLHDCCFAVRDILR